MKKTLTAIALGASVLCSNAFAHAADSSANLDQLFKAPVTSFDGVQVVAGQGAHVTINQNNNGQPPYQINYSTQLDWCQTYVSNLMSARNMAHEYAIMGDFSTANNVLFDAILFEAGIIKSRPGSPFPHTVIAILESATIATALKDSIDHIDFTRPYTEPANPSRPIWVPGPIQSGLPAVTAEQVKFIGFTQLVENVLYAYRNLDSKYYASIFNTCSTYDCYYSYPDRPRLPMEYFSLIGKLGVKFLNSHLAIHSKLGDDLVELNIAKAVTKSAKHILLSSVDRRFLACEIRMLHNLEHQIQLYLAGHFSGTPMEAKVRNVRHQMRSIRNQINTGCGRISQGYRSQNIPNASVDVDVDVDVDVNVNK